MAVERQPGLARVLLGECELADAIQSTAVPNLFVLTAGASPPNAAELLAGDRVRALLDELRPQFDFIFLDSPPINAAADAMIMSTIADGVLLVLLVLRAGRTNRATAQHAVRQLENVGARIVGAVLNDPDAGVPRYDRYYDRSVLPLRGAGPLAVPVQQFRRLARVAHGASCSCS